MEPAKFAESLASNRPDSALAIVVSAGHYPMVEQAKSFNRELEKFLGGVGGENHPHGSRIIPETKSE